MKFLSTLVLLSLAASAQGSVRVPQDTKETRTITIHKNHVVTTRRTEHIIIRMEHASPAVLAQHKSLAATKSVPLSTSLQKVPAESSSTVHPRYGGPSSAIVDSQGFGGINTGSRSSLRTLIYALPAGATTLNFTLTAGVNFSIQASSCASAQCTVQVAFTPKNPGLLTDAISVKDSSGNLIDQTFVSGNGVGPQFGFMFGEDTGYSGFAGFPTGTAWGPDGTFYVMDGSNGVVTHIVFGGSVNTFQIANICNPAGIAVDGSGTVYAADPTFNQVVAYSAVGVQTVVQTTPLLNPSWVAVDGTGALYISDMGNGRIIKLDNHNVESTVLTGLNAPAGVVVDGNGNLYFTDQDNGGEIRELIATSGQTTSIANGLGTMMSLALDAAGDAYFTTSQAFGIFDPAAGTTYIQEDGERPPPYSVAVAPNGDILTTQSRDGYFQVQDVSTGNFGLETQIQSTATGQLTITNTGNSALSLTALAVNGPAYSIDPSSACTQNSTLTPGNACILVLDFTPSTVGDNYQDTLRAMSNSLNGSGTTNGFSLFGTGDGASTNTTLTITPQDPAAGADVTFTANVSPYSTGLPNPTGSVNFLEGDTLLGSATLTNGTAVFVINSLSSGNHSITAEYLGDSNNGVSVSYTNTVTVGIGSTGAGTNLSASSPSISLNQPETFTVRVTGNGSTPTGTVMFLDGGNTIGTATLQGSGSSASASVTVSTLSGGMHGIYAAYSGDSNYAAGTSNTQNVTVAQGTSATRLSISPPNPTSEQQIVLTADVASGNNPSESGLVIFSDQNGTIGYASIQPNGDGGTASYTTNLSVGSHQVIATYTQDLNYSDSVSVAQTVVVSRGTPYTNLNVSAANIRQGQTEILMLQLGDGDTFGETGTVTFSDQNGVLGNGTACSCYTGTFSTLQLTNLAPGVHMITGTYNGDSNYGTATSAAQTVNVSGPSGSDTTTVLSVSSGSIMSGQSEMLTANIQGGTSPAQSGTVTFSDQNGVLGSASVVPTGTGSTASFSITTLSAGTHQIIANYSGDGNYNGSASAQQTVTVTAGSTATPTSTTLGVSSANPALGSSETFMATVSASGNAPSGTVAFIDESGSLATATLVVGDGTSTATATYTALPFGSHQVTATYSGNSSYATSTSPARTVNVGPATSNTTLTVSPSSATVGAAVTLTGSVQSYTSPALNGIISFSDQNGPLGSVSISPNSNGGSASLTLTSLSAGVHQIIAAYGSDAQHANSASNVQTETITAAAATATTLSAPVSTTYKTPVTFTIAVSASKSGTPLGQVILCDTTAPRCLAEANLAIAQITSNGSATIKLAPGGIGVHTYVARFLGAVGFAASISATQSVTVNGTYPTTTMISSTGAAGNYTLTGTVVGTGSNTISPTGPITFNDTTNPTAPPIGSAPLGVGAPGFTTIQAIGSPFATGVNPYAVATGDFNGDGFADVVFGNYAGNSVSVLLGNGDGTFKSQVSYAVGSSPERVLVADFDQNGIQDLVVANTGSNTVSILLGIGDGTFKRQITYAVASPVGLGVLDLNHDGLADIVAGDYYSNTMSVLLGNGDGTFKAAVTYPTGGTPQTIAEGDFNGDGNIDIAIGNLAGNNVGIFLGNGDGTFQAQVTYAVGRAPQGVQVGDFNGDGRDDLAISNSTDNTISILLGNGDGTFKPQVTYPVGVDPVGLVVTDFNGDGKQDLSVGNTAQSALTQSILLGNGDGTFQPQLTFKAGNFPYGEAVADFNGDGFPDLAISNFADSTATVFLSQVTETATGTSSGISVGAPSGAHNVNASYGGDSKFSFSTSSTIALVNSTLPATATSLSVSPAAQTLGQIVTFTANVSSPNAPTSPPGGTVSFTYNGASSGTLGSATLQSGTASITSNILAVGTYAITATYAGSSSFSGSTSVTQPLTITRVPTNSTLILGPATQTALQLQPFEVVGPGTAQSNPSPSGTQTISELSGPATPYFPYAIGVSNGVFDTTYKFPLLPVGTYSFMLSYTGDGNYAPSTGTAQTLTVTPAAAPLTLSPSSSTPALGQSETLTVTIPALTASGTTVAVFPTGTITFSDQNGVLGTASLAASNSSSNASLASSSLSLGTHRIVARYSGDQFYAASASATQTIAVSSASPVINSMSFGSVTLAGAPARMTLTYGASAGSAGNTTALAQGTVFNAQAVTCSNGVCTVQVTFTPTYPGQATDALTIKDTNGNLLFKTFLYGSGTGPQLGYDLAYGVFNTYTGTIKSPASVGVGPDGNLYIGDTSTNQVYKVTAGTYGGGTALPILSLGKPGGIAVSGDGIVYVADQTSNTIRSYNLSSSVQSSLTTTALATPTGVAVDGTGAIYIADTGHGRIIKIDNQGAETIVVTGLTSPGGITLDSAGDLFYADPASGGEISEISAAGGTVASVGSNLGVIGDIAVAPNGRVYFSTTKSVSNILNGIVSSNGYFNLSGNPANSGLALDRFQDVIATNTSGGVLVVTNRTGSSFTFGTPVGTTNTCCDTVENTGNTPLTVGNVRSNGANYALHVGGGECVAGQVLQPTQTCSVAVDFSPTAFQNYPNTVTVTSNSLNVAGSMNTSSLLETGQQIPTNLSLTVSPNAGRTGQTFTFTVTINFSSNYKTAPTGTIDFLNPDGSTLASVAATGVTTQYTTAALPAGTYNVTATYSGDTSFQTSISAAQSFTVLASTQQTITFPPISNHFASDAPFTLNATASSQLPVSYSVTAGPATVTGNTVTLTGGTGTVIIQASQAGNATFAAAASVSQSFNVTASAATVSGISPTSGPLGSPATTITLTGSSFNTGDVVQLNGAAIQSTYVNATTLTAVIPATFFAQAGTGLITVFDPATRGTSGAVTFTSANAPQIVFTGPTSSTSGAQPALTFQLVNPYPVALAGTLNLTFAPVASAGVNDPAVQFATGGRSLPFNIPANSTATPNVQLQTGTVAGTATVALVVTANGVNVTPTTVAPVVIVIPPAAPTITSTTITKNGNVLTVALVGFSNTRETTQAVFHFTAVAGGTLDNPDLKLTVTPNFATWYATPASATYGSAFTYTQIFTLDQDAGIVQNVTVTLANTVGTSSVVTTP